MIASGMLRGGASLRLRIRTVLAVSAPSKPFRQAAAGGPIDVALHQHDEAIEIAGAVEVLGMHGAHPRTKCAGIVRVAVQDDISVSMTPRHGRFRTGR